MAGGEGRGVEGGGGTGGGGGALTKVHSHRLIKSRLDKQKKWMYSATMMSHVEQGTQPQRPEMPTATISWQARTTQLVKSKVSESHL